MMEALMIEAITYGTNFESTRTLLVSLKVNGYKSKHLGAGKRWLGFGDKLIGMRDYCALLPAEQLAMFVDAYDVLAVDSMEKTEALYHEHFDGQIVFSAEKNCWPDAERAKDYPPSDSPWRFLNSGSYMGPAGKIYELLAGMQIQPRDDDQRLMTQAYLDGKVVLDTGCRIFQTAGFAGPGEIVGKANDIHNTVTGSHPTIIHFNGRSQMDIEQKLTLEQEATLYENTKARHKDIVDRFTKYVNEDPKLKAHRDYVEQNGYGYGERAFHWMWKLLVDAMPEKFRFLEIGVFKGQVPSLVAMLAEREEKQAKIVGVGRFDTFSGETDEFPPHPEHSPDDTKALYEAFDLSMDDTTLIEGDSTSDEVTNRLKRRKFELIYVDGCHEYEYVKQDLEFYMDRLADGGFLIVDDSACRLDQPWGYFQGIEPVSRAVEEVLVGWTNILTVMHNRIFIKS
jgi:hypothetical protein